MKRLAYFAALLLGALMAGGVWWIGQQDTSSGWQGYVDGDYIRVGPTLSGQLVALGVHRGEEVAPGTPLFTQDDTNDCAARDQAAAQLAQSQAKLTNLERAGRPTEITQAEADLADMRATRDRIARDLARNQQLQRTGATAQQLVQQQQADFDSAVAHVNAAEARLEQIRSPTGREYEIAAQRADVEAQQAALAQADWRLAQRHVSAQVAGRVADTYALPGEVLNAGAPVVALLPPGNIFVRFFVPERMLASIHYGERMAISCESCGANLVARVSFIAPQAEYTPPVIYSESTREKLVFLIEARPDPAPAATLKPGQPVTVRSLS